MNYDKSYNIFHGGTLSLLLQFLLIINESAIAAMTSCSSSKGEQIHNLLSPGMPLENWQTIDQDSIGVCWAASASVAIYGAGKRQGIELAPSYLDIALRSTGSLSNNGFKFTTPDQNFLSKTEAYALATAEASKDKAVQIIEVEGSVMATVLVEDKKNLKLRVEGHQVCAPIFEMANSYCPKKDSFVESLLSAPGADKEAQKEILLALSHFFDLQEKKRKESPEDLADSLKKLRDELRQKSLDVSQQCLRPTDYIGEESAKAVEGSIAFSETYSHWLKLNKILTKFDQRKGDLLQKTTRLQVVTSLLSDKQKIKLEAARLGIPLSRLKKTLKQEEEKLGLEIQEAQNFRDPFASGDIENDRQRSLLEKTIIAFSPNWKKGEDIPRIDRKIFANFLKDKNEIFQSSDIDNLKKMEEIFESYFSTRGVVSGLFRNHPELVKEMVASLKRDYVSNNPEVCQRRLFFQSMALMSEPTDCTAQWYSGALKSIAIAMGQKTDYEVPFTSLIYNLTSGVSKYDDWSTQLIIPECKGSYRSLPTPLSCSELGKVDRYNKDLKLFEKVEQRIRSNAPAIITMCGAILASKPETPMTTCSEIGANTLHAMAVVGVQCLPDGSRKFLIQNSWGAQWCPENPDFECVKGRGAFWANEKDLLSGPISFASYETERESRSWGK